MEKLCAKCKLVKQESEFQKSDNNCYCKKCLKEYYAKRSFNFKYELLQYKGGKCTKCGYSKCTAALHFHHLDPNKKEFNISKIQSNKFTQEIKDELDKCIILCANCHFEEHTEFDFVYEPKIEKIPKNICNCGNLKCYQSKICQECRTKKRLTDIPSKDDLEKLIYLPYTKIAKIYNVTDRCISKWFKKYNIIKIYT